MAASALSRNTERFGAGFDNLSEPVAEKWTRANPTQNASHTHCPLDKTRWLSGSVCCKVTVIWRFCLGELVTKICKQSESVCREGRFHREAVIRTGSLRIQQVKTKQFLTKCPGNKSSVCFTPLWFYQSSSSRSPSILSSSCRLLSLWDSGGISGLRASMCVFSGVQAARRFFTTQPTAGVPSSVTQWRAEI